MLIPVIISDKFPGYGVIAGALPDGLVTFTPPGAPGVAQLDLFDYETRERLRSTWSTHEGKYTFDGLPGSGNYGVWARDPTGAFEDMVAGRVSPYVQQVEFSGDAPDFTIGVPYSHTYQTSRGVPPYSFSITAGALPDGITLDTDTGEISGTPTVLAVASTWTIQAEDSRTSTASIDDGSDPVTLYSYVRCVLASANYSAAVEIEIAASAAGPDQCVGGTPFASTTYSGYPASLAFDGSMVSGYWCSANTSSPQHIGYQFPAPVQIGELRFAPQSGYTPNGLTVEASHDGVTWDTLAVFSSITGWSHATFKSFTW